MKENHYGLGMVKACRPGSMDRVIMENGMKTGCKVMVSKCMCKKIFMRESFRMEKLMVIGFITLRMGNRMKVIGIMINRMVKASMSC